MIPGGSQRNQTWPLLTCRCCGKPVFRSLYCSWRCAVRGQRMYLVLGLICWAIAIGVFLLMT
jgi:hypothetical protein